MSEMGHRSQLADHLQPQYTLHHSKLLSTFLAWFWAKYIYNEGHDEALIVEKSTFENFLLQFLNILYCYFCICHSFQEHLPCGTVPTTILPL